MALCACARECAHPFVTFETCVLVGCANAHVSVQMRMAVCARARECAHPFVTFETCVLVGSTVVHSPKSVTLAITPIGLVDSCCALRGRGGRGVAGGRWQWTGGVQAGCGGGLGWMKEPKGARRRQMVVGWCGWTRKGW
eukprot:364221-Chlamydomonas_euryale.AAC.9